MPKIVRDAPVPSAPANGATVGNAAVPAAASEAPAESVAAVLASPDLTSEARDLRALGLDAVLAALARPVPGFLAARPTVGARVGELVPADDVLHSDRWPDAGGVAELVERLRGFLSSAGAVALFTPASVPVPYYRRPRIGFRAGDTAADVAERVELFRRIGRPEPVAVPAGFARYVCELTDTAFVLPLGAPVPELVFDAGDAADAAPGSPFNVAERSALHPREYVGVGREGRIGLVVHPALVEAGPAHVLGAAWARVGARLFDAVDSLADVCDLAAVLAGVEPEAVGVEWPALAYRRWERVERPGEPRTWTRNLAGVVAA